MANLDKEYLGITGLASFTQNAAKLAYGVDSEPLKQNAVSLRPSLMTDDDTKRTPPSRLQLPNPSREPERSGLVALSSQGITLMLKSYTCLLPPGEITFLSLKTRG